MNVFIIMIACIYIMIVTRMMLQGWVIDRRALTTWTTTPVAVTACLHSVSRVNNPTQVMKTSSSPRMANWLSSTWQVRISLLPSILLFMPAYLSLPLSLSYSLHLFLSLSLPASLSPSLPVSLSPSLPVSLSPSYLLLPFEVETLSSLPFLLSGWHTLRLHPLLEVWFQAVTVRSRRH